jgi:hypothetical protein
MAYLGLSPANREKAMADHKSSRSRRLNIPVSNVKSDVAARKSVFSDRAAVRIGLINVGGLNGDAQIDDLTLLLHSKWASVGHETTVEEALHRLATDPGVLNEIIGEYRAAFPKNFVDIKSAERMPASKQFVAKQQLVNKYADNLAGGERRQAPLIAKAEQRGAVQPEVSHPPMPI